jgi:hypothetical protein
MKFEDSDEFDVETIITALCAELRRTTADRDYLRSKQSTIDWEKLKTSAVFDVEKNQQQRDKYGKFQKRTKK